MNAAPVHTEPMVDTPVDAKLRDREAFDKTASIRAAMKPEDAPHYTLDAFYAASMALRGALRVEPYRSDLLTLPKYDIQHLDRLVDFARGLRYVQTRILLRVQGAKELPALTTAGWELRSLLLSYGDAVCKKGLIPAAVLARVREGSGYRDLAEDLIVLVEQFQGLPASLTADGAVVTGADLTRASELANKIFLYVGDDAVGMSQALEDERRKLGGLLVKAHHQVRRGVSHFRWDEGDVNTFVPSIYVPPGARKSTTAPTTDVPPDLAALHEELHAAEVAQAAVGETTPMDPEDHPFTAE